MNRQNSEGYASDSLLTFHSISAMVGLRRTAIYQEMRAGRFPRPVKIGRASRWSAREVGAWIEQQKAARQRA